MFHRFAVITQRFSAVLITLDLSELFQLLVLASC